MEGDREHQIEVELTLLNTLIDYLLAGRITPAEAEAFYQDYLHNNCEAQAEIHELEEIFGL